MMSSVANDGMDPAEVARKVGEYIHLLPRASSKMLDKMGGEPPAGEEIPLVEDESDYPLPRKTDWPPLDVEQSRDRAKGCLLGLAVGDAVGATVEFKPRDS